MMMLGAVIGGLVGLAFALLQVKLLRIYARGKSEEVAQRAYDAVDQLKLTSFFGLPLIFAVIGTMLANHWYP
ncbi:MAG: hypothetical protein FD175_993 [Beijerinckiaceae bacterium]|nr:MAG: hypothetical protein FD175_993 [Beijerinckiaceae bacterium]